ncbi:uncharacterized protein [Henckelia pumila]|uniref:uncharacterized protein isoform X3 n=1 Tax=Henckelia pumila TaxID=405737 RepID=UPI003C6E90AD
MNSLITSTAFCPSSFQLKFSFNRRKTPSVFIRSRFSELDRRRVNLVWVVVRSSGVERRRTQVSSWMNPKSSSEDFSGWANSDGELQPNNSRRKQSLVGILGAGAAGILLVAGLTFTALSISNRTTSKVKQQMEPMTTQQEESLSSDNHQDSFGEMKNEEKVEILQSESEDSKTALQAPPGKVLVPAVVDQLQSLALSALKDLKVIEDDVQPGDLCTRREYARWLVVASSILSRSTTLKVYPAMYIENISELAFDDVTPDDPDFPSIQGLAEAGLIASKLSRRDMQSSVDEDPSPLLFSPESPLSRQDLVSWKLALEKRQLPVVDRKTLQQLSGFIDIDKIDQDAWPALVADLAAGEQGIITLAFGYTRLFQPEKPVTKAQAAMALSTGDAATVVSDELARIEAESMAENAVAAHNALIAQVEKDLTASYEKELLQEKEKIDAVQKLAEEARQEVELLRAEREERNIALMKERAAVDSEMEILSRLRREVEEQLQTLTSDRVEVSYDKERVSKLRRDAETENQEIARLQYELEVERKALSMARAWAEDEMKRAREQAKALEEARNRWESQGIKVFVDNDMREEEDAGVTWLDTSKQLSVEGTIERSENLVDKLKTMAAQVSGKCKNAIHKIIDLIVSLITILKEKMLKVGKRVGELKNSAKSNLNVSLQGVQRGSVEFASSVSEGAKRVAGDCKDGVERLSQKFKA